MVWITFNISSYTNTESHHIIWKKPLMELKQTVMHPRKWMKGDVRSCVE